MSKHKAFEPTTVPVQQSGRVVHFKNEASRRKAITEFGPGVTAANVLSAIQDQTSGIPSAKRVEWGNRISVIPLVRGLPAAILTGLRGNAKRQNRRQAEAQEGVVLAASDVAVPATFSA